MAKPKTRRLTDLVQASAEAGGIGQVTSSIILADGSELIYGGAIVEVGDRGIPEHVLYRYPGDKDRPGLEVAIQVRDGIPMLTRVTVLEDRERGVLIRAKEIKIGAIDLDGQLAYWLSELTLRRGPTGIWWQYDQVPPDERKAAMRTIERARRQLRRKMTHELLEKVAATYRAASPPRHEAVALAFDTSDRTAQRYIAAAKAKGLIDD